MTVYFIQDRATNFIKIGFTAGQAEDRLKDLQTGCLVQESFRSLLPHGTAVGSYAFAGEAFPGLDRQGGLTRC